MLIGINGRLKSGKDTTFSIIKELYPDAQRISYAAKLKDSAAASLGIDHDWLEVLKNREDIQFVCKITDSSTKATVIDIHTMKPLIFQFNVREYLQRYGTEAHRNIFGEDFWVDQAVPLDLDHDGKLYVVTDMRFPNEVQRIKDVGGITLRILRDSIETAHAAHASEQDVDHMIDYFLENNGTIDDLRREVTSFMDTITNPEPAGIYHGLVREEIV